MQINLFQAIMIGILSYLGSLSCPWVLGTTGGWYVLSRPLVSGFLIGLIMGDVQTGIIVGVAVQVVYIALVTPGGQMPQDLNAAAYIGVGLGVMAVKASASVESAVAIATAVGFTTSPASTETVLAAEAAGRDVVEHASSMMPVTILFFLLGAALAVYGVYKRGTMIVRREEDAEQQDQLTTGQLWVRAVPAITLLVLVVFGSKLNNLIGIHLFVPAINVIITAVLTACLTPLKINKTCDALGEGSRYILTTLFSVGFFLAFINIIAKLGTFEELAALVGNAPQAVIVPCAMIMGFLIAIPSGAFCAGVLTLILPTLSLLGMPSEAMGFVAIATGFGTQVSPVQINIAALSEGFKQDIMKTVRSNIKFVVGALILLIVLSFFFV